MSYFIIGDLHLYDREIRSTKGYLANNKVMLDNIYTYIEENEDIDLVIFLGDIQHRTPRQLSESYKWRQWFKKLGQLMKERWNDNYTVTPELEDHVLPVFSLRGNHDDEASQRRATDFTFFDELVSEGYLVNPERISTPDSEIIFHNYGQIQQVEPHTKPVLSLYHDLIYHTESGSYIDIIKESQPDTAYNGMEILDNVNLALAGHIHNPEPEVAVVTENGWNARFIQTGSMARTSMSEGHHRDFGVCYKIADNLTAERVDIPVLPIAE